jgi:hypothetical protein
MRDENEAYIGLLCGHLQRFTRRLRQLPPDKWDWQPNPQTPSPRYLAQHAWLWLISDRAHMEEPDASKHSIAMDAPDVQQRLCELLEEETEIWRTLLLDMSVEGLNESRFAFEWRPTNVRWLVWHMCQNVIYKHGQLAALYFQLGLDGHDPYHAPLPRDDYTRRREMLAIPAIAWVLSGEKYAFPMGALPSLNTSDSYGCTALHYASRRGDDAKVDQLLAQGGEVDRQDRAGGTPLMEAAWEGHPEVVRRLLLGGARIDLLTASGHSAHDFARMQGHSPIVSLLEPKG